MLNKISIFLQESTDDIISILVIISAIVCVFLQIPTPAWYNLLVGMVSTYLFKKKIMERNND